MSRRLAETGRSARPLGRVLRLSLAAVAACLFSFSIALPITSAGATNVPGVTEFAINPSSSQAAGHPDVGIHYKVNIIDLGERGVCDEDCLYPRRAKTHFPTGFVGDPHVVPTCSLAEFGQNACPSDAQVGIFDIGSAVQENLHFIVPAYNMETRPDQAGLVAFSAALLGFPVFLEISGRTDSDYGLDVISTPEFQPLPLPELHGALWGVPANPKHDNLRFITPLSGAGLCFESSATIPPFGEYPHCEAEPGVLGTSSTVPPRAYLQNPSICGSPLYSNFEIEYYNRKEAHAEAAFPEMTGCDQLGFSPSQTIKATTTRTDTASGIDVDLKIPQAHSPSTPSQSELRTNITTLPLGFSINPSAADGKLACGDVETSIGTLFAATCPEFSKVGTLELDVAALPAPIPGALYLGSPKPGDPYRLILTADGFATHVKLVGSVRPDPVSGQLTVAFEDLPQSPVQEISMHFFGSERGLLATPTQCGTYGVGNEFIPWTSQLATRHSTSFVTLDSGPGGSVCPNGPRPFNPRVAAGSDNSTAGIHAPFSFTIDRDDGDQNLTGLSVSTPPGFAATLKGVPYCSEAALDALAAPGYSGRAEQASAMCPAASRIGTAVAGAGAGSHPLYTEGKVYLAGPYKGAPLSLEAVVPAVSGPYDLGVVAVRAAIHVNPLTAQVTTVADPLPQIFEGIPLRTRFIQVNLDRPDFALNPTNCDPMSVDTTATGDEGAVSMASSRFQVSNCVDMPYGPKLSLTLSGGVRRRGHPAIHAVLTAAPGEANTRQVSVTLPHGELLDNAHFETICTRVDFARESCPEGSAIGQAEAISPLLDQPLKGTVFLRASSHELPDVVIDLRGQLNVELAARVDSVGGRLRTTFEGLPDAPVSTVVLDLLGGKKGLLQNSESLCPTDKRATTKMIGQNGTAFNTKTKLRVRCGSKARHKRHRRRHVALRTKVAG